MEQTKITVKIYEPLLKDFDSQINTLFIKRDAFLNNMIKGEVRHLASDMKGKKLSSNARRFIAGELKRMGTATVNVVVDKSTASELNAVVKRTNMVRDAFINRMIMLLRSSGQLLRYLDLPEFITGSAFEACLEPMPTSPMKAIEAVHSDPLFYLRVACEERNETGLYLMDLPQKLAGFSCYLSDDQVPGTEAHAKSQRDVQDMLVELATLEADAFRKPDTSKKKNGGSQAHAVSPKVSSISTISTSRKT